MSVDAQLTAFLDRADVSAWRGLDPVDLADVGVDAAAIITVWAERGDPPHRARWCPADPGCFEDGVHCWIDDSHRVELIEGRLPALADGRPVSAPDLGEPELRLDTKLDVLTLADGELVYAARGLAVRVNPENGLLLGLLGFAPTTADDYVGRLRPVQVVARPLMIGGSR